MPAGSFEKTSLGWQFHQLQQRVGEWFELKFSQAIDNSPKLPDWGLPPWLEKALFWLAQVGAWLILALFLAWVSLQLYQLLRPYWASLQFQTGQSTAKPTQPQSNELTVAAWLRRSQHYQQQGNYGEACRALYMAMLQRLNDANLAPHELSRTDGEYRQLIQSFPQPQPYQILIATHEQLCFGSAKISSEMFERCQQAYREIEVG